MIFTKEDVSTSDEQVEKFTRESNIHNHNVRSISIIIMHQMDQEMLSYLMLMTVSIGIKVKVLENGLLILWEIYSM